MASHMALPDPVILPLGPKLCPLTTDFSLTRANHHNVIYPCLSLQAPPAYSANCHRVLCSSQSVGPTRLRSSAALSSAELLYSYLTRHQISPYLTSTAHVYSPGGAVMETQTRIESPGPADPVGYNNRPPLVSVGSIGSLTCTDSTRLLNESNRNSVHMPNRPPVPQTTVDGPGQRIYTQNLNPGITRTRLIESGRGDGNALPDILNSHMVGQQTTLANVVHNQTVINTNPNVASSPHRPQHRAQHSYRRPHASRRAGHTRTPTATQHHETCKEPCLKCLAAVTSFRCVLIILSLLGVCCVITGIILGALHAISGSFLFLAIMFLGLGVVLVIIVFVGWKCTPRGHQPCHALFGLGEHHRPSGRRRRHRRNRNGNWHGGIQYPEFQHRRPPPSYAVSMQDYQQHIVQAQQHQLADSQSIDNCSLPSSPPPTYRSHASSARPVMTFPVLPHSTDSRPPTYRSHASSSGHGPIRPSLTMNADNSADSMSSSRSGSSYSSADINANGEITNSSSPNENMVVIPGQNTGDRYVSNMTMVHPVVPLNDSSVAVIMTDVPVSVNNYNTNSANPCNDIYQIQADYSRSETNSAPAPDMEELSEEYIENLLESTLRTFDEITNSVDISESPEPVPSNTAL